MTTTRVTTYSYDFRGRRIATDGEVDAYEKRTYDNLDRVTKVEQYDTNEEGNLVARSETKYDDRGRVYQSVQHGVDPSTGTVGNALTDNAWFDDAGNVIKQQPAGAKLFTKTKYDGLGRRTKQYQGVDVDESTYAEADDVDGDTILEQTELSYDSASNVVQTTQRQRYHNATGTGELGTPSSTQPKARVTSQASWQDPVGRLVASANYGTNGGTVLSRPSTIPARSDDVLVTSVGYDEAGQVESQINPGGIKTCLEYDAAGRQTKQVLNCVVSSSSSSSSSLGSLESDDTNVTVLTAYNADGNVASITAKNSVTGDQVTQYIYGTTLSNSSIASSLLKRKEIYPDSVDETDVILFEYNRQGEVTKLTDQNGTIHQFDYDALGRQTHDRATTLGTGVDGGVRRLSTTYEVRGMRRKITSYNSETVGSGSVVNEVQFAYNNFGQITHDYQAHGGAVNTSTTPKVQYGYANGSANTIRPTTLTYPNGRVITYDYGSANSIPDAASRIASIVDDDGGATHLADYSYLGLGSFVEVDYTEPEIKWTLIGTAGGNDPDTGDIYRGFDRFGRVKDNYWYDYGSSIDVDRIKYGYDRNGNRLYRENTVATANGKSFDELYDYDLIDRLKEMSRGDLNNLKSEIANLKFRQDWSLDATGNWRKFLEDSDGNGSWNLDQTRTANLVNEIADITESTGPAWVTPVYSKAGNMTTMPKSADPTSAFYATYDAWNRLVKIEEDDGMSGTWTVAEYDYDGAERRSIKEVYASGVLDETRHFFYTEPSKWQVVEERVDSSSDAERQFVWGLRYIDDLVGRDRDTTGEGTLDERVCALQDANFIVTTLVDTTRTALERYVYDPYGALTIYNADWSATSTTSQFGNVYTFTGRRLDWETSLQYYRTRYFSNQLGRFVSRDPILYEGSKWNVYGYVGNSPLLRVDPFGLAYNSCYFEAVKIRVPAKKVHKLMCVYKCKCFNGNYIEEVEELATIWGSKLSHEERCRRNMTNVYMRGQCPEDDPGPDVPIIAKPKERNKPREYVFPDTIPIRDPLELPEVELEDAAAVVTAGVVLYWLISEGSRILCPPRNLIPIP
ncbi:MAG: RHS repeat-associated core domain-containing protein [Planctomycetota bacterium]